MTKVINLRLYALLDIRSDLIKELHESPRFRHLGTKEMVRRLARIFNILYL